MRGLHLPNSLKQSSFYRNKLSKSSIYRFCCSFYGGFCRNCVIFKKIINGDIPTRYYFKFNSFSFYINTIAYYERKRKGTAKSFFKIRSELITSARKRKIDKHRIIFVVEYISPRLLKTAYELKNRGITLHVLIKGDASDLGGVLSKLKLCSDKWDEFNSVAQLMSQLMHSRAFVIHYFMDWSLSECACVILQQKQLFMKIVVEHYDVLNGMYLNDSEYMIKAKKAERYCFENADGIVYREFSGEYLEKKLKFKIKGKQLIFLDYFSVEDAVDVSMSESVDRDELSLVYVGGIATEREYPNASYACFLELADICEKNQCHFHVYPSIYDEIKYADYIEYSETSEYFHFHKTIPFSQLIIELSRYDFGVMPIKSNFMDMDENGYYKKEKMIYGSTNKYFDYLQAGLPIVAKTPTRLAKELAKHEFVIEWAIEEYDFDRLRSIKKIMKQKIMQNRASFSIEQNISNLIEFYHSL